MENSPAILKTPVLKQDEDYNFLREAGRKYIEELGSVIWTDYNEHDPGITILEALCYAITELGYRTSFPIKNLLTEENGRISSSQTFFSPKNILTQSPLNKNDYRKLLIDIEGVQNAWLFTHSHYKDDSGKILPAGEESIYADKDQDQLTFTSGPTTYPIYLRGLYRVLLDLDDDPQLGDLNNGEIDIDIAAAGLKIIFDPWDVLLANHAELFSIDIHSVPPANFPPSFDTTTSELSISFAFNGNPYTIKGIVQVVLEPASGPLTNAQIGAFFTSNVNLTQQVLNLYLSKVIRSHEVMQTVTRKLFCFRNLCEDFVRIETVTDEEIAFCFDADIIPSADMEEVEANILFTIEQYLDPGVKFYLLNQMIQKTNPATGNLYTVDEIFEGPRLRHGFIDTFELENTNLRQEIYASEIISQIMGIRINDQNVVLAVRDFRMTAYDDKGNVITADANQRWCIKVKDRHKPVLARNKSKITIYKNDIPFLAREKETIQTLEWLESLQAREKIISKSADIKPPQGSYFPVETYTSIQNLFPLVYGVGHYPLPSIATEERRAQAKQLKAYLLFYDQLLADFCMQLKNAKELFSTDSIKQTYYAQLVTDFLDFDAVYAKNGNDYLLKKDVLDGQDSTITPVPNEWENLYESNKTFVDRRNRFLDHLMARFAESFSEYVFMMYTLDNSTQQETKIDPADLIQSKIDFLVDYPNLSYNRAKAFSYCPLDANFHVIKKKLWNTSNVSGLERKLCLLGGFAEPSNGMKNYYRRFLRCIGSNDIVLNIQVTPAGTVAQYSYTLTSDTLVLTSGNYSSIQSLETDLSHIVSNASVSYNAVEIPLGSGQYFIQVTNGGGSIIIQSSNFYGNAADANTAINAFVTDITKGDCSNEGLYLIEHILLRPRDHGYKLAPVCLEDDCASYSEDDPYSFRISIVMPYWVSHFNNMNFRRYFENLAREEAPAHCMVKVCWINQDAMLQFEILYFIWIQAMAAYYSDKSDLNSAFLQEANNDLLAALTSLHSEYPFASLHDCDESKDTNPVMLGQTVLGTIK